MSFPCSFPFPGSAFERSALARQAWNVNFSNAHIVFSNDDLTVSTTTDNVDQPSFAIDCVQSGTGKYYWETVEDSSTRTPLSGLGTYQSDTSDTAWLGRDGNTLGWLIDGSIFNGGALLATWAAFGPTGSVRKCYALDMVNNTYYGRVGPTGLWNNSGTADPATNVGGLSLPSGIRNNVVPAVNLKYSGDTATGCFDPGSWVGTPPSGFGPIG